MDFDFSGLAIQRDFHHAGAERAGAFGDGEAERASCRARGFPVAHLRDGLEALASFWRNRHALEAEVDRVHLGVHRHPIDHAFDRHHIEHVADGAPVLETDSVRDSAPFDVLVGDLVVGNVNAGVQQHTAFAHHAMLPAGDLAGCVLCRLDALERLRAEHAVGDVLLAGPDQLNRAGDLLGDPRALGGVVAERAPAEAAAHEALVYRHLVGCKSQRLGDLIAGGVGALRALPDFGGLAVRGDAHHGVQRLHLGVIAVVAAELGLEFLGRVREGRVGVALFRQGGDLRLRIVVDFLVAGERLGGVELRRRAFVPDDFERRARRHRLLEMLGDDRDAVRQTHRAYDAGHFPDVGIVPAFRRAGVNRRVQRGGIDHARQLHVDRVLGRAVDLERGVAARHALADQAPVLARLQLLGVDRGKRRRYLSEPGNLAVAQPLAVGGIDDEARFRSQRCGVDTPLLGGIDQQNLADLRPSHPQVVEVELRGAAADDLHHLPIVKGVAVTLGIAAGHLDRNLRPIGVHFLRDDHRQRGRCALAHLRARAENRHRAVRCDPDPGVVLLHSGRHVGVGLGNER